jgi:SAM-dependent methyltransferase
MVNKEKNLVKIYADLGDLRNDFRNTNLIELITSLVKGEKVLEIGCGNGVLLEKLQNKGKKVLGIEPNSDLIDISKKNNPNLNIKQGFAEDLNRLIDDKFDVILMIDVLEHIENDEALLDDLSKFLNDGGEIIFVVPAYQFLHGVRDKNIGHFRRYSKKTLTKLLNKKDFNVSKSFYWNMLGFFPYFISEKIFKKPLETDLRSSNKLSFFKRLLSRMIFFWFKYFENKINFGFGLSLICIAKKKS